MGKSQVPSKYVIVQKFATKYAQWYVKYQGGVEICCCNHREDAEAIAEAMTAYLKCTCEEEG